MLPFSTAIESKNFCKFKTEALISQYLSVTKDYAYIYKKESLPEHFSWPKMETSMLTRISWQKGQYNAETISCTVFKTYISHSNVFYMSAVVKMICMCLLTDCILIC